MLIHRDFFRTTESLVGIVTEHKKHSGSKEVSYFSFYFIYVSYLITTSFSLKLRLQQGQPSFSGDLFIQFLAKDIFEFKTQPQFKPLKNPDFAKKSTTGHQPFTKISLRMLIHSDFFRTTESLMGNCNKPRETLLKQRLFLLPHLTFLT